MMVMKAEKHGLFNKIEENLHPVSDVTITFGLIVEKNLNGWYFQEHSMLV